MTQRAYDRLTALDNSFLVFEGHDTHMHVASTMIFEAGPLRSRDGGIDVERIRDYIGSRLHLIPRYRQRLAYIPIEGRAVWVDDERLNLNYHVRHTSLPRPGDERQLKRLSARVMSQQLDRGKPLWETWVVEGLEGDRFALVSKTHHCMIDGISGADLISVLMRPKPDDRFEESPAWIPRPRPSSLQLLRDELLWRVRGPLSLLEELPAALRRPAQTAGELWEKVEAIGETVMANMSAASPTPLNRTIGPHRRFDWLEMQLADLKAIKDRLGGTVNDVVLATVAGALRRLFEGRRFNVDVLRLRAMVPVSVRSQAERGSLGNRVAAWMTDLPVSEPDPLRRLELVRETTAHLKDSRQALGAELLTEATEWTPSTLLTLAMRLSSRALPFNLVVTNVPGPQVPLYLLRSRLIEAYPLVPLWMNQGLGVALFSYAGKFFWGISADWDLVPDLHDFVLGIRESFRELQELAEASGAPTRKRERAQLRRKVPRRGRGVASKR
jgi:diacylglycerol O-acyltransferase / wax synthase